MGIPTRNRQHDSTARARDQETLDELRDRVTAIELSLHQLVFPMLHGMVKTLQTLVRALTLAANISRDAEENVRAVRQRLGKLARRLQRRW